MPIVLDCAYAGAFLLAAPLLAWRRWKRGPGSLSISERLGNVPARPVAAACVWIHAVSLGEVNATRTIVAELRRRRPDIAIVISATTRTGLERARALYPHLTVIRFPLDFSFAIRRTLAQIRPSVIVLMELEVWPNLIELARRQDVAVLIANGRVTDEKSMRRFTLPLIRGVARRMFGRLSWVCAQDATYAQRFAALGVPPARIETIGSLKYDAADVADRIDGQDELADAMGIARDKPVWVCGSTGPGEEALILDAYAKLLREEPALQLVTVPRKPERFDEVADLIVSRGYACLRRSTGAPRVPPGADAARPVFLGDTLGELRKFYALATVVFVGRSLVPMGGSDVMEVAGLAKALFVGPHTENFEEAVNLLLAEGGCRRISSPAGLVTTVGELLKHPDRRQKMGAAARQAILSRRGATEKTVDRILEFVRA